MLIGDSPNMLERRFATHEQAWIHMYRMRPYLMRRPHEELVRRVQDILRNLFSIAPNGKVWFVHQDRGRAFWMEKLAHANQEAFRRCEGTLVDLTAPGDIPFTSDAVKLMQQNLHLASHLPRRPVFAKYGKLAYMQDLQRSGAILLSPASHYKDIDLGIARQDDELYIETKSAPCDYDFGLISEKVRRRFPQRQWLTYKFPKPSNFYLYCVTTTFDFRYFVDFADGSSPPACLLITDQKEFERRLLRAVKKRLEGWRVEFGPARYVDPFTLGERLDWVRAELYFYKNFRYLYQGEHRMIAVPPKPSREPLDRIPLEIGSLSDISELVNLTT